MPDRILADRYKLSGDKHVGRQGMVLHAHDTLLGRQVAIKLGGAGEGQESMVRRATLVREAKYLARFQHPNIVSLFDFFQVRDSVGFVMPYLRANLGETAGRSGLDLTVTLPALKNVAQALDFCADNGVAHRDVKPANILIGPDATAFLCDFGIAAEFASADHWGGIVGTEPFIRPECFLGAHEEQRRLRSTRRQYDQFAFGVTVYQILTGRIPFGNAGGDRKASCTALQLIKRKSFPPCHLLNEKLPRTVDDVVSRMMSVDPEDRYPSNSEAIAALDAALSGHVGGARRIFISYSHADRPVAQALAQHLEESSRLEVWWDRALVAGVDWGDQIEEAMEGSDLMIVLLSPNSAHSSEVKLEWRYWLDALRRPLISLVLEDCRIPYRLFSHQHLIIGKNTNSELKAVAADICALIPKVLAAFQAAARRTAHLRPGGAAPALGGEQPRPDHADAQTPPTTLAAGWNAPTLARGRRPLDDQPTLACCRRALGGTSRRGDGGIPSLAPDTSIFATVQRRGLEDYQTAALVLDERQIEDFATRVAGRDLGELSGRPEADRPRDFSKWRNKPNWQKLNRCNHLVFSAALAALGDPE